MVLLLNTLQEDDVFSWRADRIKKNAAKGGYVLGKKKEVDVFVPKQVQGTRSRKPNSLYANFL